MKKSIESNKSSKTKSSPVGLKIFTLASLLIVAYPSLDIIGRLVAFTLAKAVGVI